MYLPVHLHHNLISHSHIHSSNLYEYHQIRGVSSIQGCSARAVYIWRAPNIVDDARNPSPIVHPSLDYQQCTTTAFNLSDAANGANPKPLTAVEVAETRDLCKNMHFDAVSNRVR
jgi:hypothetical protein